MPKIPTGYMPLDDALAELGPALIGKGWIGELTKREHWLVKTHKSGRSIIDGSPGYAGPREIPLDLCTERDAALNRDSTMRSQREQAIEWLDDHELLFETADGDEDDDDDAVVPVAKFRAALKAAGLSVAPPAAASAPASPATAVPPRAASAGTTPPPAAPALTAPSESTRNKGGRPRQYDRDAFHREIIRLANTPDGLPGRLELMKIMAEWCVETWGEQPSESKLREWIALIYETAEK